MHKNWWHNDSAQNRSFFLIFFSFSNDDKSKYFFLELNTSRIYCSNSTTWSSSPFLIGCGECQRTRFKFSESSHQRQPDCFVGFQRHHVLGNQTNIRVCHCIDELHNTDHRIGIRNLKIFNKACQTNGQREDDEDTYR